MSIFCPTLEQPRYTLRQQQAARDLPRAAAAAAPATEAAAYHTGWIALTPGVVRARLRGQLRERGRAGSVLAPCPMRTLFLTGKRRMLLKMRRIRMRTRRVNVPPLPPPTMHCIVSSEAQASRPEAAASSSSSEGRVCYSSCSEAEWEQDEGNDDDEDAAASHDTSASMAIAMDTPSCSPKGTSSTTIIRQELTPQNILAIAQIAQLNWQQQQQQQQQQQGR